MKLLKQKNNKSLTPNRFSYIRINFQLTEFVWRFCANFRFIAIVALLMLLILTLMLLVILYSRLCSCWNSSLFLSPSVLISHFSPSFSAYFSFLSFFSSLHITERPRDCGLIFLPRMKLTNRNRHYISFQSAHPLFLSHTHSHSHSHSLYQHNAYHQQKRLILASLYTLMSFVFSCMQDFHMCLHYLPLSWIEIEDYELNSHSNSPHIGHCYAIHIHNREHKVPSQLKCFNYYCYY